MIDSLVVGQKLQINRNGRLLKEYGLVDIIIVREVWDERTGKLSDESGEITYSGSLDINWFDYYGTNVNSEVLDLVSRHQVKSFQAVLEDGKIINLSCLN